MYIAGVYRSKISRGKAKFYGLLLATLAKRPEISTVSKATQLPMLGGDQGSESISPRKFLNFNFDILGHFRII